MIFFIFFILNFLDNIRVSRYLAKFIELHEGSKMIFSLVDQFKNSQVNQELIKTLWLFVINVCISHLFYLWLQMIELIMWKNVKKNVNIYVKILLRKSWVLIWSDCFIK